MRRGLVRAVVAVAALVGGLAGTAQPAAAAGPEYVDFHGHGWGHGRGMGQYGALGYANQGWTADKILGHFYGNTSSENVNGNQSFRVYLCDIESPPGQICIRNGALQGGGLSEIRVTSGAAFRVEGNDLPAGQAVILRRLSDRFELWQAPGGCGAVGPWAPVGGGTSLDLNMDIDPLVLAPTSTNQMLRVCPKDPKDSNGYYRGSLDYTIVQSRPRLLNVVGLDDYLRGVIPAEMPASWPAAAVQAQAVAARSYALADSRFDPIADTCDTTQCQVYGGASAEAAGSNAAVTATAGKVRTRDGQVISTEFSSSTGGWTAGGTFPPVQDLGDAVSANPNHDWVIRKTDDVIEARYPSIGDFERVEITQRNGLGEDGGRVLQARVVGSAGSVTRTGNQLRSELALKSDWFTPVLPAKPKELVWTLRSSATPGQPTNVVRYGGSRDTAISCDWDGDGDSTLGVYTGGRWFLRNSLSSGTPDVAITYGTATYTPVCGDWDGDGTDTIGVYTSDGWWHLRNDNGAGSPHVSFQYGYGGAIPVVGDWDGDGTDGIGVYDRGSWMLRDTPSPGAPQRWFTYGYTGPAPVVGDWDGDDTDGIGVYDRGSWMLRETPTPGQPQRWFSYGYAGTTPITGRWAASSDGIGIITLG